MFGLKADRQQGAVAHDGKSNGAGQNGTGSSDVIPSQYGAGVSDSEAVTVISEDIVINGNISAQRPVCLEGTVEGDLHGDQVIVGKAGAVTGSITANAVEVHGRVLGSIHSKSVMLYKTAHVEGDIVHQGIGIEMGTHYDGRLKWDTAADSAQPQFNPAHAAPKPVSANGPSSGHERPREFTVAYNAEATSPQF